MIVSFFVLTRSQSFEKIQEIAEKFCVFFRIFPALEKIIYHFPRIDEG